MKPPAVMVRTGLVLALPGLILGGLDAAARADTPLAPKQAKEVAMAPSASRPAPPQVAPVEHEGVRYAQQAGNTGGYLEATDIATGKQLWVVQVYEVTRSSGAPSEVMGIYFKTLKLGPGADRLTIENEVGFRYEVNLKDRSVRQVKGPPPKKEFTVPQ